MTCRIRSHLEAWRRVFMLTAIGIFIVPITGRFVAGQVDFQSAVEQVQSKVVKIYGAGGREGMESYQSGMIVSQEGAILTVWSYVLDVDPIVVVLDDGRKFEATLKGYDPRIEIALLSIEAADLPFFNVDDAVELSTGQRVLSFSNLFGVAAGAEDASVLHGHVSAVTTLDARRGAFQSTYSGRVLVLDAMTNNPGAAGGVLTDSRGRLAGVLGKELRSSQYNTWLNYAIPIREIAEAVENIKAGRWSSRLASDEVAKPVDPLSVEALGIVLIHNTLDDTPPFVDRIVAGSTAEKAGLQPDDLLLFLNDRVMRSIGDVLEELSYIERDREISIAFRRGDEIKTISIRAK